VGDGRYGYVGAKSVDDSGGGKGGGVNIVSCDGVGDGDGVIVGEKRKGDSSMGEKRKKAAKELGMFLCSNELGFSVDDRDGINGRDGCTTGTDDFEKHRPEDENEMNFRIDLPGKFYDLLGVPKEDVRKILF